MHTEAPHGIDRPWTPRTSNDVGKTVVVKAIARKEYFVPADSGRLLLDETHHESDDESSTEESAPMITTVTVITRSLAVWAQQNINDERQT